MTETLQNESQLRGSKSRKTLYNVTSKSRPSLPQSPEKFARVINSLDKNTTPRKRQAVHRAMEPSVVKKLRLEKELQEGTKERTST